MRNISFMLTVRQFLDGSKDVTRRLGWENVKIGEELCGVEKGQGLRKGEKINRLGTIRVKDARREPLSRMIADPVYGKEECRREGFPDMTPAQFVEFFCRSHKGVDMHTPLTRIQFEHTTE